MKFEISGKYLLITECESESYVVGVPYDSGYAVTSGECYEARFTLSAKTAQALYSLLASSEIRRTLDGM